MTAEVGRPSLDPDATSRCTLSILVCTCNRSRLLAEALAACCALRVPAGCTLELVVVDNNSTDDTRTVVEQASLTAPFPILYDVEPRQGKSFALNRGLSLANGEVVLMTDDDVVPDVHWVERTAGAFREKPDLTFVFGKVLPRWQAPPPPVLLTERAQEIWGPLALVDYGDTPIVYTHDLFGRVRLPVGANVAFRRDVLVSAGGYRVDLGKVGNSLISGEDYEIFHRLHRAGRFLGMYDPGAIVHHHVPARRVTRAYFKKWFFWQGRTIARMLPEFYPEVDLTAAPTLAGAPRFLYRQFAGQALAWLRTATTTDPLARFIAQLYTYRYLGILVDCSTTWAARRRREAAA